MERRLLAVDPDVGLCGWIQMWVVSGHLLFGVLRDFPAFAEKLWCLCVEVKQQQQQECRPRWRVWSVSRVHR